MTAKIQTPHLHSLPPAPRHSISVHMPGWGYMLRFMDRDPELLKSFKSMYPRMILHRDIKELTGKVLEKIGGEGVVCLLFSDLNTAKECVAFATAPIPQAPKAKKPPLTPLDPSAISIRLFSVKVFLYAVIFPATNLPNVFPFWVHTGTGISSRLAEDALSNISLLQELPLTTPHPKPIDSPSHILINQRIADLQNRAPSPNSPAGRKDLKPEDVYLFQTGMTTIYQLHKYLSILHPDHTPVLYGFAFHSTPHIFLDINNHRLKHIPTVNPEDLITLENYIKDNLNTPQKVEVLWTEFPANPLLHTADLSALRSLADKYNFLIVVDDTVSSFCNVDLLSNGADIIVSSLTKSFSGYADVMGGSICLNPNGTRYPELKDLFTKEYVNLYYEGDAQTLERNSQNYLSRSITLNRNAQSLVTYLHNLSLQPSSPINKVFYPTTSPTQSNYERYMRTPTSDFKPGYGCLFNVELQDVETTIAFYDSLNVHHGPHLGAHLTLALPYSKAIYGNDLEQVDAAGVRGTQIRVSVGLEEEEDLLAVFREAVEVAEGVLRKRVV